MDLEEAFRHALDGNAILFLGAGFSLGAKNKRNDDFPLSNELSKHLLLQLGESEPVQLQTASEMYIRDKGEVGLFAFLSRHLGVQSVGQHQKSFARPQWLRVWTTNYDEVFEVAAREAGQQIRSLILSRQIPPQERSAIDCIHINGFLPWANAENLNSTLILSETAYLTARFAGSPWASLLRSDIDSARAVIFAGYSLSDLDIARVLVAVEDLKRKCVFILGPNAGRGLTTTVEKFGTVSPIRGVDAAANVLDTVAATHEPAPRTVTHSSFRPIQAAVDPRGEPTAKDVFNFLVKGEINLDYLSRSLIEPTPHYAIHRSDIDEIVRAIGRGAPVVIALSRLGNGKTVLSECVAAKARDRYDVFIFTKETHSISDEIRALRTPARPTLIVVDDYSRRIDLVRELRLGAGANQHLLLTSRTPTHLIARNQLQAALGDTQPVEFRVDTLTESNLADLDSILAGAGLLGGAAAWRPARRIQELYREQGAGELGGILLWLLDSPAIRARLVNTFTALKGKTDPQRVVIAAMALTHIGQPPDLDDIADFVGANSINQAIFSEDAAVSEFVRFDHHRAYARSSLFAVATLRALWDEGGVPYVLEEMLRRAHELRSDNKRFRDIARDLMRYSKMRQIVPTDDPSRHVQLYYDRIRNLPPCVNNQLFWLQFSLADIERKQFDLAERHLEQSYAIASKLKGYDTYQIDNVKALFLLSREIQEQNDDRAFRSFVEASTILHRQMRGRRHAYYPFRIAKNYGEFWGRIASRWDKDQKAVFIGACQTAYRFAQGIDPDLASMDDIARCREIVENILVEVGALPAN